jgi:hypothetical protein
MEIWERPPPSCRMSRGGKKRAWWAPWEAVSEIRECPPPIFKTSMAVPLGGIDRDPGAPTTYLEDVDGRPHGKRCRRSVSIHHLS